jgi:hypothetical protein
VRERRPAFLAPRMGSAEAASGLCGGVLRFSAPSEVPVDELESFDPIDDMESL